MRFAMNVKSVTKAKLTVLSQSRLQFNNPDDMRLETMFKLLVALGSELRGTS
ncbi:Uncharacterised protein [Serratia plymuthica]|nr:Uncharacterised protein [Serratia plymuthica]